MYYISTRDASLRYTASEAIVQGLSRDGGLFLPASIPQLTRQDLEALAGMTYQQRAVAVMKLYLEEFSSEELADYAARAYAVPAKFDDAAVTPIFSAHDKTHFLELWHGPTCAFKDMALQMLPHLLTASLRKTGEEKTVCILVATSGDTGKAALEGFCDVERTKILVFYPKDGVSEIQQLQMVTQGGKNVGVCAVEGNFDDAQTGVKRIFSDEVLRSQLAKSGYFLSSANSINWGRVLPQIVYYVSAYCELVRQGKLKLGDTLNYCVPTGNFGNILAGCYAKRMGVPVGKLLCASNANNVLTDFIRTGVYDRNRPFYNTISPSMDILISSNLERLLYLLSGSDEAVKGYMRALQETGRYEVSPAIRAAVQESFLCGCCGDARTLNTIGQVFRHSRYLMDTHTAVAYTALMDHRAATGDDTPTVVVSTASPFKFCDSVLTALGVQELRGGVDIIEQLEEVSGCAAPAPLRALRGRAVRFRDAASKEAMAGQVAAMLR
ncbi:MAG: threonine synthase [Oscillospiraceae bacterium]|nr:threonine synthase [Oscillospiraceae bacterium]